MGLLQFLQESAGQRRAIIMRGISGCGKSTYVRKHYPNATVVSADHYFERNGKYEFDRDKLGHAHGECFRKFTTALHRGDPLIVVDNTNTRARELSHYYDAAINSGYEVTVVRLVCDPEKAAKRNVHQVPAEVVANMAGRFEPWPKEVLVRESITEAAPPDPEIEKWIVANKAKFRKEYGDKWEEPLYATAWKMYNNK